MACKTEEPSVGEQVVVPGLREETHFFALHQRVGDWQKGASAIVSKAWSHNLRAWRWFEDLQTQLKV